MTDSTTLDLAPGAAIKAFRKRHDPPLRLSALADRIGTTTANLSRIENGKQAVSEDLLPKIIDATGIPGRVLRPDLAELFQPSGVAQ